MFHSFQCFLVFCIILLPGLKYIKLPAGIVGWNNKMKFSMKGFTKLTTLLQYLTLQQATFLNPDLAKPRVMYVWVPTCSSCQRPCMQAWFTYQRACVPVWFRCQRDCVPTCQKCANLSFLRAIVSINVPTAIRHANFSTWPINLPKGKPIFQIFVLQKAKENFYTLLSYKKLYIKLDITVIHTICLCIVHKNCIILYFYASCYLKKKCVEFLFFIIFYLFAL